MGEEHVHCHCKGSKVGGCHNAIYGLGVIGAAVYFIQTTQGFWPAMIGILKALVWPAIILYKVLEMLKV